MVPACHLSSMLGVKLCSADPLSFLEEDSKAGNEDEGVVRLKCDDKDKIILDEEQDSPT